MLILGIDTSCDDTSAAVVQCGTSIISNVVSNQSEIHARFGGIVPEIASRKHTEMIIPVVSEAMKQAGITLSELDAIAVCHGPGLIGSLLVGCSFAKALCYGRRIPLVAVNHIEGHLLSSFLEEPRPAFPFLSLIVSGGHTSLYLAKDYGVYRELGRTRDDAAGEAYDKVAKLLGLGYPGGPLIDRLALEGDPDSIAFPRPYLPDSLDFSFSGIKTAVLNHVRKTRGSTNQEAGRPLEAQAVQNVAASFQAAMLDVLVRKTEWAIRKTRVRSVTISGGVAANQGLRKRMRDLASTRDVRLFTPSPALCTDNAAMIASAAYYCAMNREFAGLDLNPQAYLRL